MGALAGGEPNGVARRVGPIEGFLHEVLTDRPTIGRWEDAYFDPDEPGPWRTLQLTLPDGRHLRFERDVQSRGLPAIEGEMPDGREWTLTDSPEHGLCVTLGEVDVGCEDVGPGIEARDDPAVPRPVGSEAVVLLVGYLPPEAAAVSLEHDDGRPADMTGLVLDAERGLWGTPVAPDDVPDLARYSDDSGRQVSVVRVDS